MSTPTRAGWYDDPDDSSQLRYFDGVVWSQHRTSKAAAPRSAPVAYGGGQPPTYPPADAQPTGQTGQVGQTGQAGQTPPQAPGQPRGQQRQQPGQTPMPYPQQGGWSQPAGAVQGPVTVDGVLLASYWQRVGAFVLDWIIQSVIGLVLGGYFLFQAMQGYLDQMDGFMADVEAGRDPDFGALIDSIDTGQIAVYTVIGIAVFVLYQYLFLTRSGQTPGKMVVGISVREKSSAGVPSGATVLRRVGLPVALFVLQFVPFLSWLGSIGRILDLLFPAWDKDKQALHDKLADTVVVVGKQPRTGTSPQQQSPQQQSPHHPF